jgi:hypothetical protein
MTKRFLFCEPELRKLSWGIRIRIKPLKTTRDCRVKLKNFTPDFNVEKVIEEERQNSGDLVEKLFLAMLNLRKGMTGYS